MRWFTIAAFAAVLILSVTLPAASVAKTYHYGAGVSLVPHNKSVTMQIGIWLKDRIHGNLQNLAKMQAPMNVQLHVSGRTWRFKFLNEAIPEFSFAYYSAAKHPPNAGARGTVSFTNAYGSYSVPVTVKH